jgi:hypothetical protein
MANYSDKLKDPRWQKKRLEILNRDEFTCQYCSSNENTLHVHHKYYIPEANPWEYNNNALITLCEYCHEQEHTEASVRERYFINLLYDLGMSPMDLLIPQVNWFENFTELNKNEIIDTIILRLNNLKSK